MSGDSNLSNGLVEQAKSISNNLFRHIFLTYFTELNPSINEKIRVGELIGQKYKATQMEKYRRIKHLSTN